MIELQTARLRLRALGPQDRDALLALDGDPEVMRYLGPFAPPTAEGTDAWLANLALSYPHGSRRGFWAAERDGEFVGWFHLRPSAETGECELGYRLLRHVWNQGYATEAGQTLLHLAWADEEPLVIATTDVDNRASRRVMEKLGMKWRRDFLYDGLYPSVEYAIARPG